MKKRIVERVRCASNNLTGGGGGLDKEGGRNNRLDGRYFGYDGERKKGLVSCPVKPSKPQSLTPLEARHASEARRSIKQNAKSGMANIIRTSSRYWFHGAVFSNFNSGVCTKQKTTGLG